MPESPTLGSILKPSSSHPSSSSKSRASGQDTREKSVRYGSIRVHEDRYCYSQPVAMTTEGQSLAAEQLSPGIPSEDPEEEDGDPCSWGLLQPRWCQMFRNPKAVLFCFCWAGAIQVWYRKYSSISHTKSSNLKVSHLVLQLSLPNPLKPSVKLRMKI